MITDCITNLIFLHLREQISPHQCCFFLSCFFFFLCAISYLFLESPKKPPKNKTKTNRTTRKQRPVAAATDSGCRILVGKPILHDPKILLRNIFTNQTRDPPPSPPQVVVFCVCAIYDPFQNLLKCHQKKLKCNQNIIHTSLPIVCYGGPSILIHAHQAIPVAATADDQVNFFFCE